VTARWGAPEEMSAGLGGAFASAAKRRGAPGRAVVLRSQGLQVIRATVRDGRIVVDEPTTLPDGHEVALGVLNDDGMSEAERRRLYASITRGIRDGQAGREMEFDSFLDQLDAEP
jgi:hypothetical protein